MHAANGVTFILVSVTIPFSINEEFYNINRQFQTNSCFTRLSLGGCHQELLESQLGKTSPSLSVLLLFNNEKHQYTYPLIVNWSRLLKRKDTVEALISHRETGLIGRILLDYYPYRTGCPDPVAPLKATYDTRQSFLTLSKTSSRWRKAIAKNTSR